MRTYSIYRGTGGTGLRYAAHFLIMNEHTIDNNIVRILWQQYQVAKTVQHS